MKVLRYFKWRYVLGAALAIVTVVILLGANSYRLWHSEPSYWVGQQARARQVHSAGGWIVASQGLNWPSQDHRARATVRAAAAGARE